MIIADNMLEKLIFSSNVHFKALFIWRRVIRLHELLGLSGWKKNSLYETELPGKHEAYVGFEMGHYKPPN